MKIQVFLAPKILPKPSPKPLKIDTSKKHVFSNVFFANFDFFKRSKAQKLAFRLDGSTIFKVFAKIAFLLFPCIFGQKNLPKTLPKRGPKPSKIDAKNMLFFNIDLLRFRPRFWSLLGLQLGAKLGLKLAISELGSPP